MPLSGMLPSVIAISTLPLYVVLLQQNKGLFQLAARTPPADYPPQQIERIKTHPPTHTPCMNVPPVASPAINSDDPGWADCHQHVDSSGLRVSTQQKQRVKLLWWNDGTPLSGLQAEGTYRHFPLAFKNLRMHDGHLWPRVAAATDVHHLGTALLAVLFSMCVKKYRVMGYKMRWELVAQQPAAGQAVTVRVPAPQWVAELATPQHPLQQHEALWHDMTAEEQAALMLFTKPPVRLNHPHDGDERVACIRIMTRRDAK